jgi:restriction system protein
MALPRTIKNNADRELLFNQSVSTFDNRKSEFEEGKQRDNEALENIKALYKRKDPKAIEEYCDLVLNSSEYPDYFPQNWLLEYRKENRIAIVEYSLPSPEQLPTVESYKYLKSRDEVSEKALTQAVRKKLFDGVIYQICIRTIHELFEADVVNALGAVAFNGLVTNKNPATGIEETKVIMSIMANKDQFMSFDLAQVDPKATFKHMKGVAASSLVDLTPIPPIIQLDKSDKRFISGRNVVGNLDESINLAAMHWDDFEHLIRELFEKEFASNGGEVKITQASSDGGVDAIAFDPDPIRGGKIVIQAKRYTNVVGVAAVRDLYGTVMNEGATKGILVTTSDYGRDSYEFAKDKPLTLLNGSNLLSLLEKHGHKARINVAEAKKILNT